MKSLVSKLMAHPTIYSTVTLLLRGRNTTQSFVNNYVRPEAGDRILDIGCGTGDILNFLHDIEYCGFDLDPGYIEMAKKKYGNRGVFFCKAVSLDAFPGESTFDIILAMGIAHHLNDDEAKQLFELAYNLLKPNGRLITYDGCFIENQSIPEIFFLSLDRGKYVRTREEYNDLARSSFSDITTFIRHDLLNIPYTIIIMECKK